MERMQGIYRIYMTEKQLHEEGKMSDAFWDEAETSWQGILAVFKRDVGLDYVPPAQMPSPSTNEGPDPSARGHSRTAVPTPTAAQQEKEEEEKAKKEAEDKAKKQQEAKAKKEQEEKAKPRSPWGLAVSMHAGTRIATQAVTTGAKRKRQVDSAWVSDHQTHSQIVDDARALFVADKSVAPLEANWVHKQIPENTGFPLAPAQLEDKAEQERLIQANTRFEQHFAGARGGGRGSGQPKHWASRPYPLSGPNKIIRMNDGLEAKAKEAFGAKEKQAKVNLSEIFVHRGASAPTYHEQGTQTAAPADTRVPAAQESIDPAYLDENGEFDPELVVLTDEEYAKMANH